MTQTTFAHHLDQSIYLYLFLKTSSERIVFGWTCKQTNYSMEIAWKVIGIFQFVNFLTETSEQHKGRLLVIVSFFIYFRRASSLSETSFKRAQV